ncbi:unnamed protein product [Dovyalis caffra]|uniref:Transmembrane protein n=1 Tax=Dovyalis caffra TaxID=77055 RepID=A0AAV1RFM3_9ROSI|nr:unnamed protein product [Dovyalis caffra]
MAVVVVEGSVEVLERRSGDGNRKRRAGILEREREKERERFWRRLEEWVLEFRKMALQGGMYGYPLMFAFYALHQGCMVSMVYCTNDIVGVSHEVSND